MNRRNRTAADSIIASLLRHQSHGEVIVAESVGGQPKNTRTYACPLNRSGALPLHKAQHYRVRDFQGIHYKFGPVHPRFFIEPSTTNHFTPFRRFKKFGYSHLSAAFNRTASPTSNGMSPSPQSQHWTRDCALLALAPYRHEK